MQVIEDTIRALTPIALVVATVTIVFFALTTASLDKESRSKAMDIALALGGGAAGLASASSGKSNPPNKPGDRS